MWSVQVFSKMVLHLPAAVSCSSLPDGGNAPSGPAQQLRKALEIPAFQSSTAQDWHLWAPYGTLIWSSYGPGHRAAKALGKGCKPLATDPGQCWASAEPPVQIHAAALSNQKCAYFWIPAYNLNCLTNSMWDLYEIAVTISMPDNSRQTKNRSSSTGAQLSLLCSRQHKPHMPTGLTFSFSSISASDSSNQRSKSGARKSGRFSCLVSLSHQLLSFFCTVMFSCLWVTLHTGWGQAQEHTSAKVLRNKLWDWVDTQGLLIKEAAMTWTAAAQAFLCHPRHGSKRQPSWRWQLWWL